MTDTSCPHCGADVAAGASSCADCSFVFFEASERRRLPRPSLRAVTALVLALAAVAVAVALITRDSPPAPPGPVEAADAAERLQRGLEEAGMADLRSIECSGPVRRGELTRCEADYAGGDTQLLLVALTTSGELDIQNPYPAQRRPGG